MVQRGKDHRLPFEVVDRLFLLVLLDMRLHHLLDRSKHAPKIIIAGEVYGAHTAAADLAHDLVSVVQDRSLRQRLKLCGPASVRIDGAYPPGGFLLCRKNSRNLLRGLAASRRSSGS